MFMGPARWLIRQGGTENKLVSDRAGATSKTSGKFLNSVVPKAVGGQSRNKEGPWVHSCLLERKRASARSRWAPGPEPGRRHKSRKDMDFLQSSEGIPKEQTLVFEARKPD